MDSKAVVIGIDIGTSDSYVGYIGRGTVDLVQNEVSQRKTPSLVGFTDRERLLGDAALSQLKSNAQNTCRNFKHLLGQAFNEADMTVEKFWSTSTLAKADDGFGGYDVSYKNGRQVFSATAITAMFLTKLIDVAETWCEGQVAHAVIGVPSYFSDVHRTAMLDAAKIAGLSVLALMNEHAATALTYAYARIGELPTDSPSTVAFCMMGHAIFSVAIVQFLNNKLTVLFEKSAKVGGRDMDECMLRRFSQEFKKKFGCDPLTSKKAVIKLEDQVARTKKILSTNAEATCGCEFLMEDNDFSSHITRSDFEEMCAPMKRKVEGVLEAAKRGCGLKVSDIDAVEICGGASRVPWVKEAISKAFAGKELGMRLNADECVARGCALQASLLSPFYKVKEYKVEDVSPFPVGLSLDGTNRPQAIFSAKSPMPVLKVLTFLRKGPFDITAQYMDAKELLPGTAINIGAYRIEVPSLAAPTKVKVKAVLSASGTFFIESAQLLDDNDAMNADENNTKFKRTALSVTPKTSLGRSTDDIENCVQVERVMQEEMREIVETNARRNDLESYILSMQSAAAENGKYGPYFASTDREAFLSALMSAEDWLFDHVDETKDVFVAKLDELKSLGGPAEHRHKESLRRDSVARLLLETMTGILTENKEAASEKKTELDAIFKEAAGPVQEALKAEKLRPKHEDPTTSCEKLEQRIQAMVKAADVLLKGPGEDVMTEQEFQELFSGPKSVEEPSAEAAPRDASDGAVDVD